MLPEIYISFGFVSRHHDPGDPAFSTEPDVDLHEIKLLVFVLFLGRILFCFRAAFCK